MLYTVVIYLSNNSYSLRFSSDITLNSKIYVLTIQMLISHAEKMKTRTRNNRIKTSLPQTEQKMIGNLIEIYRPTYLKGNRTGKYILSTFATHV